VGAKAKVGKRIRIAREAKELSQEKLAKKIGYDSSSALSLIEIGARGISLERLSLLADELGYDINYFLGEEESIPKNLAAAFRSAKDLDEEAQKQILTFVDYIKRKREK